MPQTLTPSLRYSPKRGRYVGPDGRAATDRQVHSWLQDEIGATRLQFQRLARQQLQEKLTLADWEHQFRQAMKTAHLKVAAIAAGGEDRLTPELHWLVDGILTAEFGYLSNFKSEIASGVERDRPGYNRMAISRRAMLYANALKLTFSRIELAVRVAEGDWEGWRRLDPRVASCRECPKLATSGYVAVERLVAIGDQCRCRSLCQCTIVFRRKR